MEEKKIVELTEEQVEAIYQYLALSLDDMSIDEKNMWYEILNNFDPEFDDIADSDTE